MRTLSLSLVGTVMLALVGGLSVTTVAQDDEVAAAPSAASVAEAAGTSGVSVEILSDRGVIPLEAIPPDADHITWARTLIEPGVSGEVGSAEPQAWANLEYAQQGTSWGASAERTRVWHPDGTTEDLAAGVSSPLAAGDVALYWNGGAAGEFENRGPEAYVSFFLGAGNSHIPATSPEVPPGAEWQLLDSVFPSPETLEAWFSDSIAVSFERVTMEPGGQLVLGPEDVPMLTFLWPESGRILSGTVAADSVATAGIGRVAHFLPPEPGMVSVIRNTSRGPTVVILAALSRPDSSSGSGSADDASDAMPRG